MNKTLRLLFSCLLLPLLFTGCDNEEPDPTISDTLVSEILTGYASLVSAGYEDSYSTAQALQTALIAFTQSPDETTLAAAKTAWFAAREPYGQTEVFRFYGGPIDNEIDGPEGEINAWPLDESFIDYVEGSAESGIINDLTITIDAATLRSLNEENGVEENVATGYHAIEFLLWGQDDLNASLLTPGSRPVTDYTTEANAERRKEYLLVCAEILLEDLESLVSAWESGASYRTEFLAGGEESLGYILTGMGSLSRAELGGERMEVALVNHDQEDEHSCFSDNTHRDIVTNALGIQNVFLGTYSRTDGSTLSVTGVEAVSRELLETEVSDLETALEATMTAVEAIQSPFDFEISSSNTEGNQRVQDAIDLLDAQTDLIQDIADGLDISINTEG